VPVTDDDIEHLGRCVELAREALAAAHGRVGLCRIVDATPSEQLASWLTEWEAPAMKAMYEAKVRR
jgi:hypothetical protein